MRTSKKSYPLDGGAKRPPQSIQRVKWSASLWKCLVRRFVPLSQRCLSSHALNPAFTNSACITKKINKNCSCDRFILPRFVNFNQSDHHCGDRGGSWRGKRGRRSSWGWVRLIWVRQINKKFFIIVVKSRQVSPV